MNRRSIHIGSVYEIDIRGRTFPARIRSFTESRRGNPLQVNIEPLVRNISWLHCSTRQVRKRLDRQERLEVAS